MSATNHTDFQWKREGPLAGVRIIELSGVGPGPMCGMFLADLGATVLRIDRTTPSELGLKRPTRVNLLLRSRKVIALDLKDPKAVQLVLRLVSKADGLIEGFRPGVTERLGLGPEVCMKINPRLVYGRVTGWGQTGPLAQSAGHDINYIAVTGALDAIGRKGQPPSLPLNLIGDNAGGALFLATGMLAAIIEARSSGTGQVVDAAIVDGVASLCAGIYGFKAAGLWDAPRGENLVDSGAPFYDVYECGDGKYITVGPVEAKFFAQLLERLDIDAAGLGKQMEAAAWPAMREVLAGKFKSRSRDDWAALLEGTDVCFAPVLDFDEAPHHPHLKARGTYVEVDGILQPAPAPRFSRTPPSETTVPESPSPETSEHALQGWLSGSDLTAAVEHIRNQRLRA